MKKRNHLFLLLFSSILIFSCSSDDSDTNTDTEPNIVPEISKPLVVTPKLNDLDFSKNKAFKEEAIILNINGSDFTDVEVTSSNSNATIKELTPTTYEITASDAGETTITARLLNGTATQSRSIKLEFIEHGVFNSSIVEGITIDASNKDNVLDLLGEPEGKFNSTNSTGTESEIWIYASKGFSFNIRSNNIVQTARLYPSNTSLPINGGERIAVNPYTYLINEELRINSPTATMDDVIAAFEEPEHLLNDGDNSFPTPLTSTKQELSAATVNRDPIFAYRYFENRDSNLSIAFEFISDNIDNYTTKPIIGIIIL